MPRGYNCPNCSGEGTLMRVRKDSDEYVDDKNISLFWCADCGYETTERGLMRRMASGHDPERCHLDCKRYDCNKWGKCYCPCKNCTSHRSLTGMLSLLRGS
jgi:hypothetical protein